jgi:hypothetical protein
VGPGQWIPKHLYRAGSTPSSKYCFYCQIDYSSICIVQGGRLRQQVNPNPTADVKVSLWECAMLRASSGALGRCRGSVGSQQVLQFAVGARGKAGNTVCCTCRGIRGRRPSTKGLQLSCRLVELKGTNESTLISSGGPTGSPGCKDPQVDLIGLAMVACAGSSLSEDGAVTGPRYAGVRSIRRSRPSGVLVYYLALRSDVCGFGRRPAITGQGMLVASAKSNPAA